VTNAFPSGLRTRIEAILARYPNRRAALLPVLHLVQRERGFIGPEDEAEAAVLCGLRPVEVREVLTFYTMFRREPAGRHLLRVCTNLSCSIRGSAGILDHLRRAFGLQPGRTTPDGRFTLVEVECLGACDKGPCLLAGDTLHENLTPAALDAILRELE
jgi:NADH-quinone oxidoreductase, E subunit